MPAYEPELGQMVFGQPHKEHATSNIVEAARAKAIEGLVSKESSGTVLALEGDPRPAVRADASEFAEAS